MAYRLIMKLLSWPGQGAEWHSLLWTNSRDYFKNWRSSPNSLYQSRDFLYLFFELRCSSWWLCPWKILKPFAVHRVMHTLKPSPLFVVGFNLFSWLRSLKPCDPASSLSCVSQSPGLEQLVWDERTEIDLVSLTLFFVKERNNICLLWFCCPGLVDEHASAVNWLPLGGFLAFIYKFRSKSRLRDSSCGVSYWRLYDKKGKLTWAPLFHFPKPRIACWLLISV